MLEVISRPIYCPNITYRTNCFHRHVAGQSRWGTELVWKGLFMCLMEITSQNRHRLLDDLKSSNLRNRCWVLKNYIGQVYAYLALWYYCLGNLAYARFWYVLLYTKTVQEILHKDTFKSVNYKINSHMQHMLVSKLVSMWTIGFF